MRKALSLAIVLVLAGRAAADPPPSEPEVTPASDDAARARLMLEEGSRLYTEGEFRLALENFQGSYAIDPSWRALNGMALCQRALGQEVAAHRTYQELLDEFGDILSAPQREVAEKRLCELAARLARLEISTEQPEVRITVDGREIGRGPLKASELVTPGAHQIVATRPGHRAHTEQFTVGPGVTRFIAITLDAERARVVVQYTDPPPTRPIRVWIPWATLAAGVALAGTGGLLAMDAQSDFDEFDSRVSASAGDLPEAVAINGAALDRAESKQAIAAGLAIAGGVAIVTGVALAVFNRKRGGKPASLEPVRGGAALSIAF